MASLSPWIGRMDASREGLIRIIEKAAAIELPVKPEEDR